MFKKLREGATNSRIKNFIPFQSQRMLRSSDLRVEMMITFLMKLLPEVEEVVAVAVAAEAAEVAEVVPLKAVLDREEDNLFRSARRLSPAYLEQIKLKST